MQFYVNEDCIGCGLCADTCPEVFSLTDDGVAEAINGDVDSAVKDRAVEAMESCPVNAIHEK